MSSKKASDSYDRFMEACEASGDPAADALLTVVAEVLNGGFEQALSNCPEQMKALANLSDYGPFTDRFLTLVERALDLEDEFNELMHTNIDDEGSVDEDSVIDKLDKLDDNFYAWSEKLEDEVADALAGSKTSAGKKAKIQVSRKTIQRAIIEADKLLDHLKSGCDAMANSGTEGLVPCLLDELEEVNDIKQRLEGLLDPDELRTNFGTEMSLEELLDDQNPMGFAAVVQDDIERLADLRMSYAEAGFEELMDPTVEPKTADFLSDSVRDTIKYLRVNKEKLKGLLTKGEPAIAQELKKLPVSASKPGAFTSLVTQWLNKTISDVDLTSGVEKLVQKKKGSLEKCYVPRTAGVSKITFAKAADANSRDIRRAIKFLEGMIAQYKEYYFNYKKVVVQVSGSALIRQTGEKVFEAISDMQESLKLLNKLAQEVGEAEEHARKKEEEKEKSKTGSAKVASAWSYEVYDGDGFVAGEGSDDIRVETWFERDHASVIVYKNGKEVAEWWDDDVRQAVEDGFLDPKDWEGSAIRYCEDMGLLKNASKATMCNGEPLWQCEFGHRDPRWAITEEDIPQELRQGNWRGFEDQSWHNDVCPHWENKEYKLAIWVDAVDAQKREWPMEAYRFAVIKVDDPEMSSDKDELLLQSNDWEEVKNFVEAQMRSRIMPPTKEGSQKSAQKKIFLAPE
jgi:hypothetical protein